jgi:ATP-binding cassette subfamily C protein CydC
LLADFEVLILDEPTANVDQATAVELVNDLLQAAKQRSDRAVILITHDEQLSSFADRVLDL